MSGWTYIPYEKNRVPKVFFLAAGQDALDYMRDFRQSDNAEKTCATTPSTHKISAEALRHRMGCVSVKSLGRVLQNTRGTALLNSLGKLNSPHSQAALSGMARRSNVPHTLCHRKVNLNSAILQS